MARVHPFRPYRYTAKAGDPNLLVTQPYDKISPDMRRQYLAASPHNLVRIILGEKKPEDSASDNVYTRAASNLQSWIGSGVLAQDPEAGFYPYFQEFTDPDSGRQLTRKGFICVVDLEEYTAGIIHRHEQTLSGPKKDRLELLRHTQAHFGQIFMLYPDPSRSVDAVLDQAARQAPLVTVTDGYQAVHRLWRIVDPAALKQIGDLMAGKKLVIADGHHRYETALAYSKESAKADAKRVMMTLVNMHSDGLRVLATHRLVHGLDGFDEDSLAQRLASLGTVTRPASDDALKQAIAEAPPDKIVIGVAALGGRFLLTAGRAAGALDVPFLHTRILDEILGIDEEAVRDEKHLRYIRGFDAALGAVRAGDAQAAFLLHPTQVQQVADVSFSGGVMPQKSTDFYPKLLSGLAIYRLEK